MVIQNQFAVALDEACSVDPEFDRECEIRRGKVRYLTS